MHWGIDFSLASKEVRDSITFRYNSPNISYSELLKFARETEVEERGAGSGSKGKTDTKSKAKASSARVMDSAQTSQGGASSESNFDSQGQEGGRGARGFGNNEGGRVEEIAMAAEAFTTSIVEVVTIII